MFSEDIEVKTRCCHSDYWEEVEQRGLENVFILTLKIYFTLQWSKQTNKTNKLHI